MGYMGLHHWRVSDLAADCYGRMARQMLKVLNDELKEQANCYNTDGAVNVALIIESGVLDTIEEYYITECLDYQDLLTKLEVHIAGASKKNQADWRNEDSREMHYMAYKRMYKAVVKLLKSKGIEVKKSPKDK